MLQAIAIVTGDDIRPRTSPISARLLFRVTSPSLSRCGDAPFASLFHRILVTPSDAQAYSAHSPPANPNIYISHLGLASHAALDDAYLFQSNLTYTKVYTKYLSIYRSFLTLSFYSMNPNFCRRIRRPKTNMVHPRALFVFIIRIFPCGCCSRVLVSDAVASTTTGHVSLWGKTTVDLPRVR